MGAGKNFPAPMLEKLCPPPAVVAGRRRDAACAFARLDLKIAIEKRFELLGRKDHGAD
jgi:hypothetical protein